MRNLAFVLALLLLATTPVASAPTPGTDAVSSRVLVNRDKDGLALQGYDPVAYFTVGKPVQGDPRFEARYQGAKYRFSSREHQQAFEADPARYAPQYGGYCGYAASIDKLSPIGPEWFQIVEGRLVLQHNKKAFDLWNRNVPESLAKADANWPGLVSRHGVDGESKVLINVDDRGLALQGYDPVAYFTERRPVRGDASIEAVYGGGTYRFASVEHKDEFERNPSRYAPAYGGFCAYAASIDKISPIDPEIFQIQNDRLLLQHTPKAYDLFNAAPEENEKKADRNWPGLVERRGR